jgi:hypothetical protein
VTELEEAYRLAKGRYNKLGKRAKGKPHDSEIWRDYDAAKAEYHRAGDALRKARRRDGG